VPLPTTKEVPDTRRYAPPAEQISPAVLKQQELPPAVKHDMPGHLRRRAPSSPFISSQPSSHTLCRLQPPRRDTRFAAISSRSHVRGTQYRATARVAPPRRRLLSLLIFAKPPSGGDRRPLVAASSMLSPAVTAPFATTPAASRALQHGHNAYRRYPRHDICCERSCAPRYATPPQHCCRVRSRRRRGVRR